MVERIAFTQSPRWRLSFPEWAWALRASRALIGERGVADVVVEGVGEHDEVRRHPRPVLPEEADQVPRADLLPPSMMNFTLSGSVLAALRYEPTAATWP